MGEVYKAHDGRLNRTVAIKRIIAEDHSRFESEVRAIAAINHPHLPDLRRRPRSPRPRILPGDPLRGPVTPDEAVRGASTALLCVLAVLVVVLVYLSVIELARRGFDVSRDLSRAFPPPRPTARIARSASSPCSLHLVLPRLKQV
jgi:serine/threonine protein kinase